MVRGLRSSDLQAWAACTVLGLLWAAAVRTDRAPLLSQFSTDIARCHTRSMPAPTEATALACR